MRKITQRKIIFSKSLLSLKYLSLDTYFGLVSTVLLAVGRMGNSISSAVERFIKELFMDVTLLMVVGWQLHYSPNGA